MMQIEIQVHVNNPGKLRSYIDRRLNGALHRFVDRLRAVKVLICDVNDSRSGLNKSCEITVQLIPSGIVLRQETRGANIHSTIDHAAERLGSSFSRYLERDRDRREAIANNHANTLKLRDCRAAA
jgi:ribosomal subunit interface protein